MRKLEIIFYLEERYPHWLAYTAFHCKRVDFADVACDLLHDMLEKLLTVNRVLLEKYYYAIDDDGVRVLHKYVLKMIKLNLYSPTSPYQRGIKAQRLELLTETKLKAQTDYLAARYDDLKLRMHSWIARRRAFAVVAIRRRAFAVLSFEGIAAPSLPTVQ
ncbi:MAG: hypothetical protein ACK5JS_01665 [Mangrovibacterium sp.]